MKSIESDNVIASSKFNRNCSDIRRQRSRSDCENFYSFRPESVSPRSALPNTLKNNEKDKVMHSHKNRGNDRGKEIEIEIEKETNIKSNKEEKTEKEIEIKSSPRNFFNSFVSLRDHVESNLIKREEQVEKDKECNKMKDIIIEKKENKKIENKKDEREEKKYKILRALSSPKKLNILSENSRGLAVAEILLYLPLSSLLSSLSSSIKCENKKLKDVSNDINNDMNNKIINKNSHCMDGEIEGKKIESDRDKCINNYNNDNNYNNYNNSQIAVAVDNCNFDLDHDCNITEKNIAERMFSRRDSLQSEDGSDDVYQRKLNKMDNLNLLTRAAQALSR